ncbi:MAG: efflux RND transporter periplasmic adaptor subunit [Sandaracinus sp.]
MTGPELALARTTLALAFFVSGCAGAAEPEAETEADVAAAPTSAVEHLTWSDERVLFGVLDTAPDGRATVAAQAAGRLTRLLVREGDTVEAGALLAEVELGPASDARASAQARAREAEVLASTQRTARDHLAHLVERGIAPAAQLEEANGHLAALEQAASAARAAASDASRGLARTRVTSPLGGVVLRVLRHPGETVDGTAATPILEVADPSAREIVASVAPRDLAALAPDQGARVVIDGSTETWPAHVRTVGAALDPATGAGTARLALDTAPAVPTLGLAARVVVTVGTREAQALPREAVRAGEDGTTEVLVCEGGEAHPMPVTVGARTDARVEITSALAEGARYVSRAIGLEDGAPCDEGAP